MDLKGKTVAVLATDLVEEIELTGPKQALEAVGAKVVVISIHQGELQAVRHDTKTLKVAIDQTLEEANPNDYDGAILPGGALNADELRVEPRAQEFVRAIEEAGKPLGVICHGAWLLISANLVQGRHLTSYHAMADDLRNAGAEWSDQAVVVDDNWISSRCPDDVPAFNQAFIKLMAK